MATVERLPIRMIQERLRREYGLRLGIGGIRTLLSQMVERAMPTYEQLQADVHASPLSARRSHRV